MYVCIICGNQLNRLRNIHLLDLICCSWETNVLKKIVVKKILLKIFKYQVILQKSSRFIFQRRKKIIFIYLMFCY